MQERNPLTGAAARRWFDQTRIALAAALICALVSSLLSSAIDGGAALRESVLSDVQRPDFLVRPLIFALLLGPAVETALMGWFALLLRERHISVAVVSIVSSLIWSIIHGAWTDVHGWLAAFPFLVFTYLFITRSEGPGRDGFVVATMAHFFYNTIAVATVIAVIVDSKT